MTNPARRALVVAVMAAAVAVTACGTPVLQGGKPPVIIVDIDTLRADHLGCYGYDRPTSPNLDHFAAESVRFDWALAQAPNTPPSQASIFTSLYPSTHGRIRDEDMLPEGAVTLAEVLREAGYATWGFVDGANMAAQFGLGQGYDHYDDVGGRLKVIGPKALDWVSAHPERPFFLLVHTYDTHSPYDDDPEPYRSMFMGGLEMPSEDFRNRMTRIMEDRRLSKFTPKPFKLTRAELEYARACYDGGIRAVDDWFGSFVAFLKQRDLYERSIIVVLSDHGDEFEEHDSVFHEKIYVAVTRIPLIVRFPGGQPRRVVTETVESIDVMPTLLEAVGAPSPRFIQGRSLMPLVRGERVFRQLAFSESPFFGREIAVADGAHHLLYRDKHLPTELYRFRDDPAEQSNLIAADTAARDRLLGAVHTWKTRVEGCRLESRPAAELDPQTAAQLRALGYLE